MSIPEHLLLLRGKTCFVCLNRYPYNGGHLMIATRRAVETTARSEGIDGA